MTRIIPALIMIFMGTLAALPWAPRLYGWYPDDVGVRVLAPAPMSSAPGLVRNLLVGPLKDKPIAPSDFNRARSFGVATVAAFMPYFLAVAFTPNYVKPWVLAKQTLRSLA